MRQRKMLMKKLTPKEEELMQLFWERGPLFVKDIVMGMPDPKPHVNTISTFVRMLEDKGFLGHNSFGKSHQYYPLISAQDYQRSTIKGIISKFFNNSFTQMVSTLFEKEDISEDELRELIQKVEEAHKNKK